MNWKYVEQLTDTNSIEMFEKLKQIEFPTDYVECVIQNNAGTPELSLFDTERSKERVVKSLLSFNQADVESIWDINEWNKAELGDDCIAIAIDVFGNLICFEKTSLQVIFIDIETLQREFIADSFTAFINGLY